jgi:hypothetical protein
MRIVILMMKSPIKPIYTDVILLSFLSILQSLTSIVAREKNKESDTAQQLAGLKLGTASPTFGARPVQPPRPSQLPPPVESDEEEDEEDEENPFSDSNAVSTPAYEKPEPRW